MNNFFSNLLDQENYRNVQKQGLLAGYYACQKRKHLTKILRVTMKV